jgi:ABC-type Fe3+-siderophore transport system permease subunit
MLRPLTARASIALACFVLLAAVAAVLRLMVGGDLGVLDDQARLAAMDLRLMRVLSAGAVGMALGAGGVMLQALLRNPLASPDILGPSSGATLAVVLAAYIGTFVGAASGTGGAAVLTWQVGPALAGSFDALALVYALSCRGRGLDPLSLVLVGVIVSIVCGAGVVLLTHLMQARGIVLPGTGAMLVGTIRDDTPRWIVIAAAAGVPLVIALVALMGRQVDSAGLSDDEATSVGVSLGRLRIVLFAGAGVLSAAAVVLAGPIGFVGLVAPHLVRLCVGGERGLGAGGPLGRCIGVGGIMLLASALAGAALLILADVGVRALNLASGRLPIGVVTAILGGPLLVTLIRRPMNRG